MPKPRKSKYPIHHAIHAGDEASAVALAGLSSYIDIEARDKNQFKYYSALEADKDEEDICQDSVSPLYAAAFYNQVETTRALLRAGANMYAYDAKK